MKKALFLGIIFTQSLGATEYLYPVAAIPDSDSLLMIYQKTPYHIELWQWNSSTRQADSILLSRYTPAGLRLLPGNKGYSFIDNGRIRIKEWIKRSPKNVELDGPVCNIELINWIDQSNCYASGKYQDHFGIFQISNDGLVCPVILAKDADLTYPQKVEDMLFFIERDKYSQYSIVSVPYKAQGQEYDEFFNRVSTYGGPPRDIILKGDLQPIIFLKMVNQREGFYVGHPRAIGKKDIHILFSYYHLLNEGGRWGTKQLFNFYIPTSLLFSGKESRLYEALLPLVPRHAQGLIFYADSREEGELGLYRYSLTEHTIVPVCKNIQGGHIFPPVFLNGHMYYGGTLLDRNEVINMGIEQEEIKVSLGVFSFI